VLDTILAAAPAGMIIARAPDGMILRFSDYFLELIGRPRSEIEDRTVAEVFESIPIYAPSGRPLSPMNGLWSGL
jgi:PAS domain-containing protein